MEINLLLYIKTLEDKRHFATIKHNLEYPLPDVGDKFHLTVEGKVYYSNIVNRVFFYDGEGGLEQVGLQLENMAIIDTNPTLSEAERAMAREIAREVAERKEHGNLESNS